MKKAIGWKSKKPKKDEEKEKKKEEEIIEQEWRARWRKQIAEDHGGRDAGNDPFGGCR